MFRSTSHVRTESAARYVNRLCKHWGHKFEVELTPSAASSTSATPTASCSPTPTMS